MFIAEQLIAGWDMRNDFITAAFDESTRVMGKDDLDVAASWIGG